MYLKYKHFWASKHHWIKKVRKPIAAVTPRWSMNACGMPSGMPCSCCWRKNDVIFWWSEAKPRCWVWNLKSILCLGGHILASHIGFAYVYHLIIYVGSETKPRWDPQVTFSGLKTWPPCGQSKGHFEEAGRWWVRILFFYTLLKTNSHFSLKKWHPKRSQACVSTQIFLGAPGCSFQACVLGGSSQDW